VHGFTQTHRSWTTVEARLPSDWDVQGIEVPDGLDFSSTAEAVGMRGGTGTWVGYSMGGRLCLQLALDRPDLVDRLVLVSSSPGIERAPERAERRAADERLAHEVELVGVDVFLERWLSQRIFETLPPEAAMVDDRRKGNTVHRIAHQLRALGQGSQPSLWPRLGELGMPVLIVTGAYDRKYSEIGERMTAAIGGARLETIAKAGHAVHLERPVEVAELLASWVGDTA